MPVLAVDGCYYSSAAELELAAIESSFSDFLPNGPWPLHCLMKCAVAARETCYAMQ
jgi:hypothetical protein